MSAVKFIAQVDQYNGSPGLQSTMQTIKENFSKLTSEEKHLFADFEDELISYAITYFKEHKLNPLNM